MILPMPIESAAKICGSPDPGTTAAAIARLLVDEEIIVPGYHERHRADTEDLARAVILAALLEAGRK